MSEIENITPEYLRCATMASCPSIHRLANGDLQITGKLFDMSIGGDEATIIIQPDLLDTLVEDAVRAKIYSLKIAKL